MTVFATRTGEQHAPGVVTGSSTPAATRGRSTLPALATGTAVGVLVSGFWHVRAVDGLGLAMFVTPVIGAFEGKAETFPQNGAAFGLLFCALAGLAATFTASNLASFTMLPVLVRTHADAERRVPIGRLLIVMAMAAATVGLLYGAFFGRLGATGAAAFNAGPIRSAQSFTVFGAIGLAMLAWAAAEAMGGRDDGIRSPGLSDTDTDGGWPAVAPAGGGIREVLANPMAVAGLAGAAIGLFSVGRPLAVFREALAYVAQPGLTPYAATAVALGTVATLTVSAAGLLVAQLTVLPRIGAWMRRRPRQARLIAAGSLAAGGAFLVCYWSVSRVWPSMGRWGFALGWYE